MRPIVNRGSGLLEWPDSGPTPQQKRRERMVVRYTLATAVVGMLTMTYLFIITPKPLAPLYATVYGFAFVLDVLTLAVTVWAIARERKQPAP
jgi:uncharacterized membrane protein YqjE